MTSYRIKELKHDLFKVQRRFLFLWWDVKGLVEKHFRYSYSGVYTYYVRDVLLFSSLNDARTFVRYKIGIYHDV